MHNSGCAEAKHAVLCMRAFLFYVPQVRPFCAWRLQARLMNILVVEDDDITRKRLRRLLEGAGHTVQECADGTIALKTFVSQPLPPEMVITDWMMPKMDGLTLASNLRTLTVGGCYTYIILLTSRNEPADMVNGFKAGGVDDYVVKPFSTEELEARIAVGERVIKLERAQRDYSKTLETIVSRQTRQIRNSQEEIVVRLLSALAFRDNETAEHVRRIGLTSALLAQNLGWSTSRVDEIRVAAAMHDIGKVGIADAILQKPGTLTPAEYRIMQNHALIGAQILENSQFALIQMGREVCLGHHEKWNGTGYPSRLCGENIPESARIVAVADVYDALTNHRIYRPAMPEPAALAILSEGRNAHFDPKILDLFFALLPDVRRIQKENQ